MRLPARMPDAIWRTASALSKRWISRSSILSRDSALARVSPDWIRLSRSNVPTALAPASVGRVMASVMVAGARSSVLVSGARPKAATTPKSGKLESATRVRRLKRRSAPLMRSVKILSLASGINRLPIRNRAGSLTQMVPGGFVNPNSSLCALGEAVFMVYGQA